MIDNELCRKNSSVICTAKEETPTWWYKMASPVLTFLTENDFSNKIVISFATNAGRAGTVIDDMVHLCAGATIKCAKEIRFNEEKIVTPESEINEWLEKLV